MQGRAGSPRGEVLQESTDSGPIFAGYDESPVLGHASLSSDYIHLLHPLHGRGDRPRA